MVKAALGINDPQYMNFLPTYFGDSLFWSGASMITVPTPPIGLHVINLIPGNNPGGPGFIGGLISQGAGIVGMGPIAEMPVLLLDNNWNAVGYAISNNNGNYVLPNLAYGTYIIVMDFWGKQSQHQVVTLSPTTPSIRNVDFEVHSQTITLSSEFSTLENSQILVYPNPATNLININIVNGMQGNYDFKVRDLSGKLLISESVSASQNLIKTLSLEDLSAGVYLLEINNNNGLAKYKIVKTN